MNDKYRAMYMSYMNNTSTADVVYTCRLGTMTAATKTHVDIFKQTKRLSKCSTTTAACEKVNIQAPQIMYAQPSAKMSGVMASYLTYINAIQSGRE